MKDQYERAMKLHMSNKINEKNVYQLNLNLIDCIHQGNFSNDRFLFSRFSETTNQQFLPLLSRFLDFPGKMNPASGFAMSDSVGLQKTARSLLVVLA